MERFRDQQNYDNDNVLTDMHSHTLTFCSAGVDALNNNDYNIRQLDDMLAQKEDAEKRILAKTNATLAHHAGWTSLQTQIADKQLELWDSHRTFSQSQTIVL